MEGLRPAWALKAIFVIVITSIFFRCVCSTNRTVGGPSGWDLRSNIQIWSSTTIFYVGDDLVFIYTPNNDVMEVNQLGYATCVISNAIATYDDGETVIHLTEAGTRYFVCGRLRHCQQGLKLQIQVLKQTNNGTDDNNSGNQGQRPGRRHPPLPPPPPPPPRRSPPPPPPSTLSPPKSSPSLPPSESPAPPTTGQGVHSPHKAAAAPPTTGQGVHTPHKAAAAPCHCSGVKDGMADALFWLHGQVPLITLVIFSLTHPHSPLFLI
ncbi:hypothetical protein L6164_008174 [Bauhinia variegata]|uniref:Uncharacterized protein n=1 Tax=Bauhinia variegata TaxID=167791 RepID=A0ACB9PFV4_BAUVA|nr:hypothetical protein L6164_008174 [Bauhinia variegata]